MTVTANEQQRQSNAEDDPPNRSNKKMKVGDHANEVPRDDDLTHFPPLIQSGGDKGVENQDTQMVSYKAKVIGQSEEGESNKDSHISWDDDIVEQNLEDDVIHEDFDPQCPVIGLTSKEKDRIRKLWRSNHRQNQKMGYMFLRRKLQQKWNPKGQFLMEDIGNDFYVIKFANVDDLRHYPNFIAEEEKLWYVAAWVRIPNLSIEYFDGEILHNIGRNIGKVLKIDKTTTMGERGRYTRMCIEINLEMPLLSKFRMNGRVWKIQYERFKMICFECGKMGHSVEKCIELEKRNEDKNEMDENALKHIENPEYESRYGGWMIPAKLFKQSHFWKDKGKNKIQEGTYKGETEEMSPLTGIRNSGWMQGGKKKIKSVREKNKSESPKRSSEWEKD
ncbi:LOW QUALITY PROTEIN: hypothetical protein V2J09_020154 [Rumex salicifolius]